MSTTHRYNPALLRRLSTFVETGDAEGMGMALEQLSNSEFRTAGVLLAEDLVPVFAAQGTFPTFFGAVVPRKPKAYLGTFLHAAEKLYAQGSLSLTDEWWKTYAADASPIDKRKVLESLLPLARSVEEADTLLSAFVGNEPEARAPYLLRAATTSAYYLLFRDLQRVEGEHDFIRKCYVQLLRDATQRAYNLASIIRHYFDIPDLPGHFSLSLQPYELSRLDLTPETFKKILDGKR